MLKSLSSAGHTNIPGRPHVGHSLPTSGFDQEEAFNVVQSIIMKASTGICPRVDCDFSGAREQFRLDAVPGSTND